MPRNDDVNRDSQSVKLTCEDFLLFPDDGKRHELIDGEHYVTPSPKTSHQVIAGNLYWALRAFIEQQPLGRVLLAPYDVVLSNLDIVEPDLLYISSERFSLITDKHARGAPDLVIEILSEDTRRTDGVPKRRLYERAGVSEYRVVDPELETIKIYRRTDGGFGRATECSRERGDVITTPLLPGFSASLDAVFKDTI